jgi:hypothetical protein
MTKPTMTSQWDPGNFKPLDMSKIPGYPRQMPPRYEKWLPRFTGSDEEKVEDHMSNFWAFFQLHPISDYVEDLAMKLFSATLHDKARRWYNSLPNASITSMDRLEEVFLKRWSIKVNPNVLLMRLNGLTKAENETVQEFHDKFERIVQQIPVSHHPSSSFLTFLYTKAFSGQLKFFLNIMKPRTIQEAFDIATQVEAKIPSSKEEQSFVPEVKACEPKGVPSLETSIEETPEDLEQDISQQEVEERGPNEVSQSHEEEHGISHSSSKEDEDVVEEKEPENVQHDDEVLMCPHPSDEAIQSSIFPAQEEEDEVSHFPFQDFDNTLFYDSESEGEMESSGKVDPPCCTVEDVRASHEDETMMHAISFNKDTQVLKAPAQEETNTVSYLPFQNFDDSLLYDLGSEEEMDEPLNALNPSCYDTDSDIVDDIDEFIRVGRRNWDVIGSNKDPIYDTEVHFQRLPLQLSYEVTNFDSWQLGNDIITDTFQTPRDDLVLYSPNDFRSYLEDFDEYPSEHLDLFYEENYQPSFCSDPDESKEVACLKQDTCDKIFHLPLITLPRYVTEGMVWKHVPYPKSSVGQGLLFFLGEGWVP